MDKKPNIKKAKIHLEELRQMIAKKPSRFPQMSEEEIIEALRKTREEVWEEKFATRS